MNVESDTQKIPTLTVAIFCLVAPAIAPVYIAYSFGYWMKNNGFPRIILYPYAAAFAVVNTFHNWTVCTLLFRERPREFFTTHRLRRWKLSQDDGMRELADMLGGFLNRHDIGHY